MMSVYKAAITDRVGTAELAILNSDTSDARVMQSASTRRRADYKYQVPTFTLDHVLS